MSEPFTPRRERRFVGSYRPRIDGLEKASGRALYADDITTRARFPRPAPRPGPAQPPSRTPASGAWTCRAAAALPGVVDILTYRRPGGRPSPADQRRLDRWRGHRVLRAHDVAPVPRPAGALDDHVCWVGRRGRGGRGGGERGGRRGGAAPDRGRLGDSAVRARPVGGHAARGAAGASRHRPRQRAAGRRGRAGPTSSWTRATPWPPLAEAEVVVDGTSIYHNANQGALENWCCLAQWEGRHADGVVELLRSRPDPDAPQPDAGDAPVAGAGRSPTTSAASSAATTPGTSPSSCSPPCSPGEPAGRSSSGTAGARPSTTRASRSSTRARREPPARRHDHRPDASKAIGNVGAYADHSMFALKFAPAEVAESLPSPTSPTCGWRPTASTPTSCPAA